MFALYNYKSTFSSIRKGTDSLKQKQGDIHGFQDQCINLGSLRQSVPRSSFPHLLFFTVWQMHRRPECAAVWWVWAVYNVLSVSQWDVKKKQSNKAVFDKTAVGMLKWKLHEKVGDDYFSLSLYSTTWKFSMFTL